MTRERDKKLGREQQLLEAARLGQFNQLETILHQFQQLKTKKRSRPLASLRKCTGLNSIRDPVTGFTCLHHAALNGHSPCVQLILDHGARLNAVDYKGSSALHLAAWSGNLQVIKVLLSYNSAPASSGAADTLTAAPGSHKSLSSTSSQVSQVDDQQAQLLKLSSASVSAQTKPSALEEDKHEEIDLDLRNNDGQTALSLAAQFGHSEVVAELLRHSADLSIRNNHLESPLDLACLNGHLEAVRLLLNSSPQLVHDLCRSHSTVPIVFGNRNLRDSGAAELKELNVNQRQTRSGWSSLLRGGVGGDSRKSAAEKDGQKPRRASLVPPAKPIQDGNKQYESLGWMQLSSSDLSSYSTSERLLDHSPLHYAVRGRHVSVVDLLLNHYQANLFQLSSLGSVMHEIVLNNCDSMTTMTASGRGSASSYTNGDMMKLFLAHLSRVSSGNLEETRARWNQLLSARNGQQMNVFDIINELNNRSAQQIKRNIFELNEQIERSLKIQQQQQCQPQQPSRAQPYNSDAEQSLKQAGQEQLFSNARQINSFLTMKRAQLKQNQSQLKQAKGAHFDQAARELNKENINKHHMIDGTQTIDRRTNSTRNSNLVDFDWRKRDASLLLGHSQVPLTRSVSNLINVTNVNNYPIGEQPPTVPTRPAQLYGSVDIDWCKLLANNSSHEARISQDQQRNVQEIQRNIDGLQRKQQLHSNTVDNAQISKRRSKSRDFGSLLMEVNHNKQLASNEPAAPIGNSEQLYDNQMIAQSATNQHLTNHLVRSQTDCSHLLGRLFGNVGSGDLHFVDSRVQPADLARYQQFQLQHQPRSSDNSSLLLTTSHPDNRRLVPTAIAQQHSATLDRRAINRHYHVYEHEFYPPRLITDQTMMLQPKNNHHNITAAKINPVSAAAAASERQKQAAIAIVPPFVRSDLNQNNSEQTLGAANNSRLSLNIDQRYQQVEMDPPPPLRRLSNVIERQQEQMNRFVNVNSRKSLPVHAVCQSEQRPSVKDDIDQLQQPAVHGSQSFESHLGSESRGRLFESTRQALMRDVDQMIGHELLQHKDGGGSSNGSLGLAMAHSVSSSSQSSSILTGVSLDMDTQGEHLIVSGTRVTMAPPTMKASNSGSVWLHCDRSSQHEGTGHIEDDGSAERQRRALLAGGDKPDTKSQSLLSHSPSSASSSASTTSSHRKPPQKPPRPSLKSQQIYKSLHQDPAASNAIGGAQATMSSIIYDQPSVCSLSGQQRTESRASINSLAPSPSTMNVPLPVPPLPTPKMGQSQNSITEPPKERPPPPPIQQMLTSPMLTTPLNVITSDLKRANYGARAIKSTSSSNSPPSSTTSSSSSSLRQNQSNIAANQTRVVPVGGGNRLAAHSVDVDSGFCTSNSPASHDSEASGTGNSEPNETSFPGARSKSSCRANSIIVAPPSPRTAQMSIEAALIPLDESSVTQEMVNKTEVGGDSLYERLEVCEGSASDEDSLGLEVEIIFSLLGVTQDGHKCGTEFSSVQHKDDAAHYENCIDLQQTLGADCCESHEESRQIVSGPNSDKSSCPSPINGASSLSGSLEKVAPKSCEASQTFEHANQSSESEKVPPKTPENGEDRFPSMSCKEITLKVVFDENNKITDGDEVFYIDPIELKKISNPADGNKSEAQTLTDEELCASVDKDSGYIRFTLRKRRGLRDSIEHQHVTEIVSPGDQGVHKSNDAQHNLQSSGSSVKRTKINEDVEGPGNHQSEQDKERARAAQASSENEKVVENVDVEALNKRKPSANSLQMDVSLASSSSTSSGMSIKSIVSLKEPRVEMKPSEEKRKEPSNSNMKPNLNSGWSGAANGEPKSEESEPMTSNDAGVQNKPQISLVSETAKKVEAAAAVAAAAAATTVKQPVAAARKTLAKRDVNVIDATKDNVDVKPPSVAPTRRSICWPPPKLDDADNSTGDNKGTVAECNAPIIGRVTANRLSFQKLIEEKNKSNSFVPPAVNRPKPPPPVKPAGLIALQIFKSQIN